MPLPHSHEYEALGLLRDWHSLGKPMPRYNYGHGRPYLAFLLGLYDGPLEPPFALMPDFHALITPDTYQKIAGPHGWTFLRMLQIKKGLE